MESKTENKAESIQRVSAATIKSTVISKVQRVETKSNDKPEAEAVLEQVLSELNLSQVTNKSMEEQYAKFIQKIESLQSSASKKQIENDRVNQRNSALLSNALTMKNANLNLVSEVNSVKSEIEAIKKANIKSVKALRISNQAFQDTKSKEFGLLFEFNELKMKNAATLDALAITNAIVKQQADEILRLKALNARGLQNECRLLSFLL